MAKRKFSLLIISLVLALTTLFSGVTLAYGAETNTISNGLGASIEATEDIFDSSNQLVITENSAPSSMANVSALVYGKENVYQKVAIGFNVEVISGEEKLPYSLSSTVKISIPVGFPSSIPVQVVRINENYGVDVYEAIIRSSGTNYLEFNSNYLGEYWLLLNESSSLTVEGVFERSRILTNNLQNEGGLVSSTSYLKYINVTTPGLTVAKSFAETAMSVYQNDFNELLRLYKQANVCLLDTFYNKEDYSVTENGIYAINELKAGATNEINSATNIDEVNLAVAYFKQQITEGTFSKKRASVESTEGVIGTVTAYKLVEEGQPLVENLVFSDDATLTFNEVKDGILIKNMGLALLEDEKVIENGGIYKYLTVAVTENGIVDQNEYDKLVITISLESLGVTLGSGETLQVAKYLRNRTVEIIPVTIDGDNLSFEITKLGDYAIVKQGYALESTSAFMTFIEDYGIICAIVLGVLIIIIIIIKAGKARKKRREKREYKEFKKAQKQNKKSKKKGKKNSATGSTTNNRKR